jgi:hypothetical protein
MVAISSAALLSELTVANVGLTLKVKRRFLVVRWIVLAYHDDNPDAFGHLFSPCFVILDFFGG